MSLCEKTLEASHACLVEAHIWKEVHFPLVEERFTRQVIAGINGVT